MATTLERTIVLTTTECISCGVIFGIPQKMYDHFHTYGGFYYCPNGHSQGWDKQNCKSAADKLRDEIARLESNLNYKNAQIEAERRKAAAAKGELTKARKRTANGLCPCCKRHFVNVERHMKSKHPTVTAGVE